MPVHLLLVVLLLALVQVHASSPETDLSSVMPNRLDGLYLLCPIQVTAKIQAEPPTRIADLLQAGMRRRRGEMVNAAD